MLCVDGFGFGLGNEAVAVGVEPREHLGDMTRDVGPQLGLHHHLMAGLGGRRRGLGEQSASRHKGNGGDAAKKNRLHLRQLLKVVDEELNRRSCPRVEWPWSAPV